MKINIAEMPRRLALVFGLQMVACVYSVLGVSAVIKMRQSMGEGELLPVSKLSLFIKHSGWILFFLPIAWYWFYVLKWMRDGAEVFYLGKVVFSGVVLLIFLGFLGFIGSCGALRYPLIHAIPEDGPSLRTTGRYDSTTERH